MAHSVTHICVKEVSACLFKNLKDYGFRRRSPNLWREVEDVIQMLHFQSSQWGTKSKGNFTINVAVTHPELFSLWTGRPFPANPATATWPLVQRIGHIIDGRDVWWDVDESTDAKILGTKISESYLNLLLNWLDQYSSLKSIESALSTFTKYGDVPGVHEAQVPLIQAIIAKVHGDRETTEQFIFKALTDSKGKPFEQTVRTIANRVGVNVA